jgi:PTS system nitrogen regulatory IIA component
MTLRNALSAQTVAIGLSGTNKAEVIESLLDLLDRAGKLKDRAAAKAAVLAREQKMSTGMKNGIAIPHGKTDAVDGLVACVAVSKEAVDFNALDGQGCRIFIMTLSPPEKTGPHLQFLAEVSQLFKNPEQRQAVLDAKSADELLAIILP